MRHSNDPHNGYDRSLDRGVYRYPARPGGFPGRSQTGRSAERAEQPGYRETGRNRSVPRPYPAPPEDDRSGKQRGDWETAGDRPNGESHFGREPQPVHEVQLQHITVTVWQRDGVSGLEAYSLTVTRCFYSRRHRQYLTTNKLFAEDAVLAAEALGQAYEWVRQETGDPMPF